MTAPPLIGRRQETAWLADAADAALAGAGSLVLLAGEAGVGKTHLAEAAFAGRPLLRGAAQAPAAAPYGPVVAALRWRLREDPGALDRCGHLRAHLALLLPELAAPREVLARPVPDPRRGACRTSPRRHPRRAISRRRPCRSRRRGPCRASPRRRAGDRATMFEAVRGALAAVAPAVILLDDLQWSDGATLDLLAALAAPLRELPLLVVGAYRTDEIGRGHPFRRLRADLRRGRMLRELVVNPLDTAATRELAAVTLGADPASALADTLYDRTQGVPFFVQELALGLQAGDRLRAGPDGLELEHDADVPVPETIRDAVLLRTMGLTDAGRAAAEAAAVVGSEFRLDLAPAIDELLQAGLIVESRPGHGAFRHSLVRGAIYEDIPWRRRRDLHGAFADALEFGGGANAAIAAHRLAAGDRERALDAFLAAAHELARVHAHRDAAAAALQALDLWRDGERPAQRLAALDTYARSAELAGDLAEATRALREAVAIRQAAMGGDGAWRRGRDGRRRGAMARGWAATARGPRPRRWA